MLRHVRMAAVARIAGALVAVTLSGAPRVVAMRAPVDGHRCSCKAHRGGHECACAICRKSALAAQASDRSAPACHRAAARQALSRSGPSGSRNLPCVEGTCGADGRKAVSVAGVEPFCIPLQDALTRADAPEPCPLVAKPVHDRSLEPATPPPRAG